MGLIIYFMPRNNVFNYNYSEAAPWNYGQIIAPFDFPVYKSEAQLKKEKDSICEHFKLYFTKDSTIAVQSLRQLRNRFYRNASEEIPREAYINYYNALIGLYNKGIISQNDKEIMASNRAENINLVTDHISHTIDKEQFITPDKAYKIVLAADTFPANTIAAYKLNDFIKPNIAYDSTKTALLLEEELTLLPISEGIVQNGQKIVSRGDIVDAKTYQILKSYQYEIDKRQDNNYKTTTKLLGQVLFVIITFSYIVR